MASMRYSTIALRIPGNGYGYGYGVLMLYLLLMCSQRAYSSSNLHAHEEATATVKNDIRQNNQVVDGDSEPYQHILSRLDLWMKDKRKNDKRNHQNDGSITIPMTTTRPFVTLAYAQTLDGMIAAKSIDNKSVTSNNLLLSCPQSMILTHHLRNVHDAILVGGSTFRLDQPRLNVRLPSEHTPFRRVKDPMPVILDTNLTFLQRMILGNWEPSRQLMATSIMANEKHLPDIMLEKIRAHHPIICCSSMAAQSFLDILEVLFQYDDPTQQPGTKRKRDKSYKISVYKKIDDNETEDNYMPIKITIHIAHHNKHEDDILQDITLTLLPCKVHSTTKSLDLRHVLSQLYNQFEIESVMVEGGAGILSSFLNECSAGVNSSDDSCIGVNKMVDCICVTITPKIIGGKWGLPALGGLDVQSLKAEKGPSNFGGDEYGILRQGVMTMKDGEFVSLGQDTTFIGRI